MSSEKQSLCCFFSFWYGFKRWSFECNELIVFVNSYHLNINLKFTIQSILEKCLTTCIKTCSWCFNKSIGTNAKDCRICNEKVTENQNCKHVNTELQNCPKSFILMQCCNIWSFRSFPCPTVGYTIVPVWPELCLHLFTVCNQIGIFCWKILLNQLY